MWFPINTLIRCYNIYFFLNFQVIFNNMWIFLIGNSTNFIIYTLELLGHMWSHVVEFVILNSHCTSSRTNSCTSSCHVISRRGEEMENGPNCLHHSILCTDTFAWSFPNLGATAHWAQRPTSQMLTSLPIFRRQR